jgi:hypothetical protein
MYAEYVKQYRAAASEPPSCDLGLLTFIHPLLSTRGLRGYKRLTETAWQFINKIWNVYSLEHTDITKVLLMPHHVGRSCTVIRGYTVTQQCVSTMGHQVSLLGKRNKGRHGRSDKESFANGVPSTSYRHGLKIFVNVTFWSPQSYVADL